MAIRGQCCICEETGTFYIMGKGSGDWANYYCESHLEDGKRQLGPGSIIERVWRP